MFIMFIIITTIRQIPPIYLPTTPSTPLPSLPPLPSSSSSLITPLKLLLPPHPATPGTHQILNLTSNQNSAQLRTRLQQTFSRATHKIRFIVIFRSFAKHEMHMFC